MNKRLRKWRNAGLIDEETVQRILAYEKARSRPVLLYAASGLAALSIFIGFVSFVASNWDGISVSVKLGGDLVLGIGLVFALYKTDPEQASWLREVLLTLLGGWTIASIALISQVYQLGGHPQHALAAWCLITMPVFLQGRSRLVAAIWLVAYAWTAILWADVLAQTPVFQSQDDVYLFGVPALCWVVIAIARIPSIRNLRPESSQIFAHAGAACLALYASYAASTPFYLETEDELMIPMFATALVAMPFVIWMRQRLLKENTGWRNAVLVTYLILILPWLVTNPSWQLWSLLKPIHVLLASGCFMVFWAFIAKAALLNHQKGLFRTATFFIAARMIALYFELFGNLLSTSLVFLVGGIMGLVIIVFWHRKNEALLTNGEVEVHS